MADETTSDDVVAETVIETQNRDEAGRFAPAEEAEAQEQGAEEAEGDEVAESDDETQENDDLPQQKKRGKTAQDRIDDLTRKFRTLERRNEFLEGLVSQPTPTSAPNEGAPKPNADDFDSYDEYVEALTDWKVEQTLAKQSAATAQRTEGLVQQANWAAKLEAAEASLPDYKAVVGSSEVPIAPHVGQALMDADRGPELAYHLAQHPEVADKLNKMSATKAAMELGRLETALSGKAPVKTTNAPPPATPIRSAPARQAEASKMSMDEYVEMRRKQGARY